LTSTASDVTREAFLAFAEGDPMAFGKVFFPHHFKIETPEFHYEMIDEIMGNKFVAIASPRGSAKSTRISFLYPAWKIIMRKEPFIVLVSNTFKKSAMYLDAIKMEVKDNKKLKEIFRDSISMPTDAEGDTIFKHKDGFKTRFMCRGVDQIGSLRGVKFGADRPGLIILDDIEDDELVRSKDRRQQLQDEFDDVFGIGGKEAKIGHRETQIIAVGTILHDDSQLAKLINPEQYTMFKKIKFQAHLNVGLPNEASLWPEKWGVDELREMMRDKPNTYAKEMQNDPVAGSNVRFERKDFRYWTQEGGDYVLLNTEGSAIARDSLKTCRAAIACDLAWKEKRESDASVLMPGFITPNSDILVAPYICKKGMRPDETEELLFGMVERLEKLTGSTVPIGFEKAMLENVTQWLLKQAMRKRNKFLSTKELVWDADKLTRIETRLQPRYVQHVIYHQNGMGDLEHQLERFPSGTHDDLADALQGLVQLLQFPKAREKPTQVDDEFMRMRKRIIDEKNPKVNVRKISGRTVFPMWPVLTSWR
jgi:hypothetical protein